METIDVENVWNSHITTGEPLSEEEVQAVHDAGLADKDDFDMRGGGLWWHAPTWPDDEEEC